MSERPIFPFTVMAITDRNLGTPDLTALSEHAAGGAALLFRDKDLPQDERLPLARALRQRTDELGVPLLVHGSVDLARQVGADGVHLPASATPASIDGLLVGCSCHDLAEIRRAEAAGINYITLSPVLESPGKGAALGWERFERWARSSFLPVFALGGLGPHSLAEAKAHGAWGVAGIRAFLEPS